mmetsp:Transcript_8039/g.19999  ORF Transcript_8039/g.19999 Transcript_8039/m.19999 type:complete len:301 (-) Transcript_8039:65-967(-)
MELDAVPKSKGVLAPPGRSVRYSPRFGEDRRDLAILAVPHQAFVQPVLGEELVQSIEVWVHRSHGRQQCASAGTGCNGHVLRPRKNPHGLDRVGIHLGRRCKPGEATVDDVWDASPPKRKQESLRMDGLVDFLPLLSNDLVISLKLSVVYHRDEAVLRQWRLQATDSGRFAVCSTSPRVEVAVGIVRGSPSAGEQHVPVSVVFGLLVRRGIKSASVHGDPDFRKVFDDVILDVGHLNVAVLDDKVQGHLLAVLERAQERQRAHHDRQRSRRSREEREGNVDEEHGCGLPHRCAGCTLVAD